MNVSKGQGQLFHEHEVGIGAYKSNPELTLSKAHVQAWQKRIYCHQEKLFKGNAKLLQQESLFEEAQEKKINKFNPLELSPLPLSFWRWPSSPHQGPAIYVVMDRPEGLSTPILLYIGETIAADKRWKGEHDCKTYLAAYAEALGKVDLTSQLSIRFWTDIPKNTKIRRGMELALIERWLPPFNKETRGVWMTPFTSMI